MFIFLTGTLFVWSVWNLFHVLRVPGRANILAWPILSLVSGALLLLGLITAWHHFRNL